MSYSEQQLIAMNNRDLIAQMVVNQDNLNKKAYSQTWLVNGSDGSWDYRLAASQEIAEFINSYRYSWWSKAEQDITNCKTEVVDALHFMLSQSIIDTKGDLEQATDNIYASYIEATNMPHPHHSLDQAKLLVASLCVDNDYLIGIAAKPSFVHLFNLCRSFSFNLDALLARYMGKSALNQFRQDNGYKAGTYKKLWDGRREDNFFLAQWIDSKITAPTVPEVHEWLAVQYPAFIQRYHTSTPREELS